MNTEASRVLLTRDDAANAEFSAALASVKVDPISRPLWTYEATSLNAADRDIVACLDRYDQHLFLVFLLELVDLDIQMIYHHIL